MSVCAIHQPNFFPWLGYFDKIRRADLFVFLDAVAYPKSGSSLGSWVNRVRIAVNGQPTWIRCPVVREPGVQVINRVRIDDRQPWREKLLRTLSVSYGRAPNFEQAMALIDPMVRFESEYLADFNIHAINTVCDALGLRAAFHRQSELDVACQATDLLIGLTRRAGASAYLCGGGAAEYQDDGAFLQANLELVYQNFRPFVYGSPPGFIPGLSVIDFLMQSDWRWPSIAEFPASAGAH